MQGVSSDDVKRAAQALFQEVGQLPESLFWRDPLQHNAVRKIMESPLELQAAFVLHTLDSLADAVKRYRYPRAAAWVSTRCLRRKLPFAEDHLVQAVDCLSSLGPGELCHEEHLTGLMKHIERHAAAEGLSERLRLSLRRLSTALSGVTYAAPRRMAAELLRLCGQPSVIPLDEGEPWSDQVISDLRGDPDDVRHNWHELLRHCSRVSSGSPSSKWMKTATKLVERVGWGAFSDRVLTWMPLVDRPRTRGPGLRDWRWQERGEWYVTEPNAELLKGLAWCCSMREDAAAARALTALALSSYRKLPQMGPRLSRVGNACVGALGAMAGMEGLGQLAILRVRVKFGTAQKLIEKALTATATRLGISREDVDELGVPAYGTTEVGLRREQIGEFMAELHVTSDGGTELTWVRADGRRAKSVPAAVKSGFAEDLKELKQAAKDIQKMLPAQRERIDQLFLQQKSWAFDVWRERYLEHPLVGTIARRLIWRFKSGERSADGIFLDGKLVTRGDEPIGWLDAEASVELWHPIGSTREEILGWREWLERHQIRQPFKQAHREVYLLTAAERQTRVYSNRFAAHVLKQHQFNALCAARGWKNKLRLMVDDEYPPATRLLPKWNLRAEFWIEGIGQDYGTDTNETGTYYRVATDQVRFYPVEAAQRAAHAGGGGYYTRAGEDNPVPIEEVPPLVLSEIMRDVDLFVGVASVGNDPNWSDGGPQGRYRDYWQAYSFGELGATAQTRKAVLKRLIPRLKIAERCSFSDKFLVVRGDRRTYRIHLGSGNILMEPNDQYLCIVKAPARDGADRVFLPFEGDATLSVILSKAFLLADDRKITDSTITQQIEKR